ATAPIHPRPDECHCHTRSRKREARTRGVISGEKPSVIAPPAGCPFHTRCPMAKEECKRIKPKPQEIAPNHFVACHLYKPEKRPAGPKCDSPGRRPCHYPNF